MIPKRKKIKREGKFYDKLIVPVVVGILFVGIISFLLISDWRVNKKRAQMQAQIQNLQAQLKTLEEKKKQLELNVQYGQSTTSLEEQARDKLGLKKPGEEVVSVLPPTGNQSTSTETDKSLWQKILEKIGF